MSIKAPFLLRLLGDYGGLRKCVYQSHGALVTDTLEHVYARALSEAGYTEQGWTIRTGSSRLFVAELFDQSGLPRLQVLPPNACWRCGKGITGATHTATNEPGLYCSIECVIASHPSMAPKEAEHEDQQTL